MSDQLFKLLTDSKTGPAEKLRALASHAHEVLQTGFFEIRMEGVGEVCFGDRPPAAMVCRMAIGPTSRPLGEITVSPREDSCQPDLTPFARCAELIHRLQAGYIDALTGLYNRRRLDMELAGLGLGEEQVAIAMLDIDHFKRVNDTHGHDAGDAVLQEFASRLIGSLPEGGFAARYGGEEFCVILRQTDEDRAAEVVERTRQAVSDLSVRFKHHDIPITSSAGVAAGTGRRAADLVAQADLALYSAKENGRNRLMRASDLNRRDAGRLLSRRADPVLNRPLHDLGWFGQRVVGLDRTSNRLQAVDFFGGVINLGDLLPDALSFVRVGRTTYWISASLPGLQVTGRPTIVRDDMPPLRRIHYDARLRRLYLIERQGRALFVSDLSLSSTREIALPSRISASGAPSADVSDIGPARSITAVLPLGRALLVLDAVGREICVLDRESLKLKQRWTLPPHGFELCLCYLPSLKLILAGGAEQSTVLSLDGVVVDELDHAVISAYAHPLVGLVLSTPGATVQVK